ncbi:MULTISPECIES: SusC/RagA family TonB-linked outer membrane protein [unclassified Arcicella]|uniref:SusC/RagA family TonB-linked outer membrane protein n=1 Tax=unclassified Arcicella TaxID=2644986 RepID=UPI002856C1BF|nr:TonB-linked SusC/RagA family outer membrane protein [Arcicella sp. BE51]MDR6811900.1 TonB-linked SusC/RagA family outer membrane protein [Arcicella sp. BE140]MDR6822930.1 TonB-linked SusC/RagA family outer membrane protein [Arcicella sp. BE139]
MKKLRLFCHFETQILPRAIIYLALMFCSFTSMTQDLVVKGTVTDKTNSAVPGVAVQIKGTNQGTNTDATGNYKISIPSNATLIFSSIGYVTQEIVVGGKSIINVSLVDETKNLEEVVVTALGIKKEAKKLGYATASVNAEQITTNRQVNFMNGLQGKMAGVNITSLGTGPAGTSKIRIRGQSSFNGQNNPLIVVNGVPMDNTNFGANPNGNSDGSLANRSFNTSDGGDGLTSINPDDIETMTVLKGATAAALYGSRAKDGVVMITTKTKGTGKGIGIEYNSNYTVDTPLDYTDFQYEYGQGENGVRPTTPNPQTGVWSFGEKFQPGMKQILFDGIEVPYEPVYNRINKFYRTGTSWTNTVSLSSGSEKGGFNLSLSNLSNTSIVPNSDYNKKTINLGFNYNLNPKLILMGNINYSNEYNRNPPQIGNQDLSTPTVLYTLSNSMPFDLLESKRLDANGDEYVWSRFRNRTNPYYSVYERFENIRRDRILGNITLRYNVTDWLYLQGRIGQDYYSRDQDYNFPTGEASLGVAPVGFVNGQYTQETRRFRETNADFLIGAKKTFGDFNIDLTLGGNQMYRRSDYNSVYVQNFVVRGLYTVMNGQLKDPLYGLSERQVNSLYGAAEISYKNFLFVNVTSRNDWFSTLAPGSRAVQYPSVTGSFVFTQAFNTMPDWLSFGKLRAAYAEVGSDTDVQPYANNLFYTVGSNLLQNQPIGSINTTTVPNSSLRPMRVNETEFGVELKLFQNKIGLDFSYYKKITSDQILSAQVSDASGYQTTLLNSGKSQNEGIEAMLTFSPVKSNKFSWDVNINGSYNTSKVLELAGNQSNITVGTGIYTGVLRQVVGLPLGQLYGFAYKRDEQGRKVFNDQSGRPERTNDLVSFGSALPKWVGGITNNFRYKDILFSFLIDFKLGGKMISGTNYNAWREGLHKGTLVGREQNYVIGEGVNSKGEPNAVKTPLQSYYETIRANNIAEEFVYDSGFWKLRQITIGYDFTKKLPKNWFIKGIKLNAVANNVLMIKKWVPNLDPEQFGFSSDNLVGLESTGLPTSRSIGFNLNVKF